MVVKLNKGDIPSFRNAIISELNQFIADIELIRNTMPRRKGCSCDFHEGSVLYKLPLRASESIDAVITSPPYCNRYDYTRTYALELAYLGVSDTESGNCVRTCCHVRSKTNQKSAICVTSIHPLVGLPTLSGYAEYSSHANL